MMRDEDMRRDARRDMKATQEHQSPYNPHGVPHLAADSQRLVSRLKCLVEGMVLVGALVATQVTATAAQRR